MDKKLYDGVEIEIYVFPRVDALLPSAGDITLEDEEVVS